MSTPFDLKNLVTTIRRQNPSNEVLQLCTELMKRLPQPRIQPGQRGKVCPDCSHKMHNRCLKCPNCKRQMLQPRNYRRNVPTLSDSDCNICGNSVSDTELVTLECEHVYHRHCLSVWAETHEHCCHCRHVKIPAL
jgi:hypothetical protein